MRRSTSARQSGRRVRRNPSGLPIPQNAATGWPASSSSGRRRPSAVDQLERSVAGLDPRSGPARRSASARMAARSAGLDQVGPRQDHDVGPPQRANRLAEQAAGQQSSQPERIEGIDQHQVEVAREPTMLEAVVEHQQLGLELLDRDPGQIGRGRASWRWGTSGRFSSRTRPSSLSPCDLPVAPAEDGDPLAAPAIPARHPLDHGRLAGAARRSGCRPRRPGRRLDALASQPRS